MMTSDNYSYYTEFWSNSIETYKSHPTSRHRRRFVLQSIAAWQRGRSGSFSVFDYGCGPALLLKEIAERFHLADAQLGGCDLTESAIDAAKKKLNSPCLIAQPFPELDRKFEVIVCTEVIEHTPDYADILKWISEHIVSGGLLVLTTPGTPMDPPDEYYGHIQHFEVPHLVGLLKQQNFEVTYARRWGFPLFTLQKLITKRHFDRIKENYMHGEMNFSKRVLFGIAYSAYLIHGLIPLGPQIFIRARKK